MEIIVCGIGGGGGSGRSDAGGVRDNKYGLTISEYSD